MKFNDVRIKNEADEKTIVFSQPPYMYENSVGAVNCHSVLTCV